MTTLPAAAVRFLVYIVSLAAVAAPGAIAPAQAAFPGVNGKIAFISTSGPGLEPDIYVMNADGSNRLQPTTHDGYDARPIWSPDGAKIAFVRHLPTNDEIFVINADGSGETRLTTDPEYDQDPAWSPDGSKIIFTSYREGDGLIYVMNADGSGQTRLGPGVRGRSAVWSPDGSKIAFETFSPPNADLEIWVMKADGTGQTRLTTHPGADVHPDWSPDGSKITFSRQHDPAASSGEIWVMNADGTGQAALTASPAWELAPAWSPDGSRIAYSDDGGISIINADGSGQTTLGTPFDAEPDWQPLAAPPPDTTAPVITLTTPPDGAVYLLGQSVAADYQCEDEAGGSGLASCVGTVADGAAIDTTSAGLKVFTVAAADSAGNESSVTHGYRVIFRFDGFFPPIANPPAVNTEQAGRAISIRFSLAGDQGLNVLAAGAPRSSRVDCESGADLGDVRPTEHVGPGLAYHAGSGRYHYVWKTERDWARTCRRLDLELVDGSHHYADFRFR